jgi:hypothetical protein
MTEDLIQKLIDLVQKGAPLLWEIARKQVLNTNIQDILITIVLIVGSCFLLRLLRKLRNQENYDYRTDKEKEPGYYYIGETEYGASKIFGYIAIALMWVFTMTNIVSIVMRFVNPDYYALRILIGLVK